MGTKYLWLPSIGWSYTNPSEQNTNIWDKIMFQSTNQIMSQRFPCEHGTFQHLRLHRWSGARPSRTGLWCPSWLATRHGRHTKNHGKPPCLIGNSTISTGPCSMSLCNKLPEDKLLHRTPISLGFIVFVELWQFISIYDLSWNYASLGKLIW